MVDKKIGHLFHSHVKILQNQLEQILEKEPINNRNSKISNFEAITNLDNVSIEINDQFKTSQDIIVATFSQLTPYFESGLLFHKQGKQTKAIGAFDQGDYFPLKGFELEVSFHFPEMTLLEVRRVHSKSIFSELKKLNVLKDNFEALIFSPHPEYIFLVTSRLAQPWLKNHIEKIQAKVLKIVGDL